jgi:hypothetical protein
LGILEKARFLSKLGDHHTPKNYKEFDEWSEATNILDYIFGWASMEDMNLFLGTSCYDGFEILEIEAEPALILPDNQVLFLPVK